MQIPKDMIVSMIENRMGGDHAQQAAQQLPDQVDHEQHAGLLNQFGINPEEVMSQFGGGQGQSNEPGRGEGQGSQQGGGYLEHGGGYQEQGHSYEEQGGSGLQEQGGGYQEQGGGYQEQGRGYEEQGGGGFQDQGEQSY
jgi:hypothetical protein